MKKYILLLVILLQFTEVNAQTYIKSLAIDSAWQYTSCDTSIISEHSFRITYSDSNKTNSKFENLVGWDFYVYGEISEKKRVFANDYSYLIRYFCLDENDSYCVNEKEKMQSVSYGNMNESTYITFYKDESIKSIENWKLSEVDHLLDLYHGLVAEYDENGNEILFKIYNNGQLIFTK